MPVPPELPVGGEDGLVTGAAAPVEPLGVPELDRPGPPLDAGGATAGAGVPVRAGRAEPTRPEFVRGVRAGCDAPGSRPACWSWSIMLVTTSIVSAASPRNTCERPSRNWIARDQFWSTERMPSKLWLTMS